MSKETMKLALEALEYIEHNYMSLPAPAEKAITALREALAEQPAQQEPVAFYIYKPVLPRGSLGNVSDGDLPWVYDQDPSSGFAARMLVAPVTSPPAQRTWVNATTWRGLTDDEIYSVLENLQVMHHRPPTTDSRVIFARAIEAKLKEKNT